MPPAQKPRNHATKRRQSTASSRKSALIWYGSGVASGVLAALLAGLTFWPIKQTALTAPAVPAAQIAATPAPATKSSEGTGKPRFDFYTVLHDQEVRVSEDDPVLAGSKGAPPATVPTPAGPAKSIVPGTVANTATTSGLAAQAGKPLTSDKAAISEADKDRYLLQVGSFTQLEDADRLRAQLLLLGLQATIQKIPREGQTWHRVQVGPFSSQDQLNSARRAMNQQQIESIVLKLR